MESGPCQTAAAASGPHANVGEPATLAGVDVGIETLRTHAEAAGSQLEGQQRAAMAQVQATQEPPAQYAPVADSQTRVVETDGVMVRYRDRHLDGTLIEGDWHEIKLGLVGAW